MKKQLILFLVTILSISSYSQISFEKGYYIDNTDQKINCLIKNIDWRNNPTEFEYRLSENSTPQKGTIKSVKEFSVDNSSKYIRATVNIDRSSNDLNNLSDDEKPIFNEEELFLKILVEGKSNLYEYIEGNLKRYFYSKESGSIEQLIFKSYRFNETTIGKNNKYRQQLWANLKCNNLKMSKLESLSYSKNDLVKFFIEYSKCNNYDSVSFEVKQKKDLFNLNIRPRFNSASLIIDNIDTSSKDADFGNKTGFGFGIEAEFILPFNKNKWAIAIEPTYQNFKAEKATNTTNFFGRTLIANVDYSSIEVPLGLRYYFFLNSNSKIFVNTSYVFGFNLESSIKFTDGNSNSSELEVTTTSNLALGIGYKQNNRYSLEIRYQTNREILGDYLYWDSKYKTMSLIFGYSLF